MVPTVPVTAVRIARYALEITGPDGGLAQHVVMTADDDLVARRLHVLLPPGPGLAGDRSCRGAAAEVLATNRIRQIIPIAHHKKANIANLERVPLPDALDRIGSARVVNPRGCRAFAHGIDEFAEPPVCGLSKTACCASR